MDRDGVSTGRVALEGSVTIPLRVREKGKNAFEARVTDGVGRLLESACRHFTIIRGQASVSTDQVRQTIAVKIQTGQVGNERKELEPLVRKGEGVHTVRAAKDLRGGEPGFIAIELYEQTGDLKEPTLNLMVGDLRIDAMRDLDRSDRIRRSDELNVHWKMNESGLLSCSVETVGRILDGNELYIPQDGHVAYGGADGAAIASELLSDAVRDLDQVAETLGRLAAEDVSQLKRRVELRQHLALSSGVDAEIHRGVAVEARRIHQDGALLKLRPEHRERVLAAEPDEVERRFDELRDTAPSVALDRFDRLLATARRAMRKQNFDGAERAMRDRSDPAECPVLGSRVPDGDCDPYRGAAAPRRRSATAPAAGARDRGGDPEPGHREHQGDHWATFREPDRDRWQCGEHSKAGGSAAPLSRSLTRAASMSTVLLTRIMRRGRLGRPDYWRVLGGDRVSL